jgi:hypothetical protein
MEIGQTISRLPPFAMSSRLRRREFIRASLTCGLAAAVSSTMALGQTPQQPFRLAIRREYSLSDLVGSGSSACTYGRLWVVAPTRNLVTEPLLRQEKETCETMELPHRGNAQCISHIPSGTYKAAAQENPRFGWHIRLADVPDRTGVLLHVGNSIEQTDGCILVGTDRHPKGKCDCLVRDPAKKLIYDDKGCRISGGPSTSEIGKACAAAGIALPGSVKAIQILKSLYADPMLKRPVSVIVLA